MDLNGLQVSKIWFHPLLNSDLLGFIHIHPEFEDMSDLNLPGSNMETPKVHMMHQMAPDI